MIFRIGPQLAFNSHPLRMHHHPHAPKFSRFELVCVKYQNYVFAISIKLWIKSHHGLAAEYRHRIPERHCLAVAHFGAVLQVAMLHASDLPLTKCFRFLSQQRNRAFGFFDQPARVNQRDKVSSGIGKVRSRQGRDFPGKALLELLGKAFEFDRHI